MYLLNYCSTPLIRINWEMILLDMHKIRITGFLIENRVHLRFEVLLLLFTLPTSV
jgi:hypothetical protein